MRTQYQAVIDQLLTDQQTISEHTLYLSLYHPSHTTKEQDTEKSVKSLVMKVIQDDALLIPFTHISQKLSVFVLNILEKNDEQKARGFAFFASFNPEIVNRSSDKEVFNHTQYQLIELTYRPEPSIFLGKTYDFSPLFYAAPRTVDAMIAILDGKHISLYHLLSQHLEFIQTWDNPYLNMPDERILSQSSSGQGNTIHGTGEHTFSRKMDLAHYKFAEETLGTIVKNFLRDNDTQQCVLYFSSDQQQHIDELTTKVLTPHSKIQPLIIRKFPSTDQQIIDLSQQAVLDQHDKEQLAIAENIQENRQQYAVGWEEVLTAVRENRIDQLFITPETQHFGYIAGNNLIYLTPSNDQKSEGVKNITPWLAKVVLQAGGQIIPNDYILQLTQEMIAGRLRW